jgi:hypothetical protein
MSKRIFCKVFLVAVILVSVLVLSNNSFAQERRDEAFERVRQVHAMHTDRLLAIKDVVGTAVGLGLNDQLVITVFTTGPGVKGISKKIDDVTVNIVVTGKFHALQKPDNPGGGGRGGGGGNKEKIDPTNRFTRPVPIGISTGNAGQCSSGTIGCRVTDGTDVFALSNNHVYALQNNAPLGSEVLQPGLVDTGCTYDLNNVIGSLFDYVAIDFSGFPHENVVDAAIALTSTNDLDNATPSNGYGIPKSPTVEASLSQKVMKYGRTSALTKGTVTGIDGNFIIGYGGSQAFFVNQIIVQSRKPFIKAGDSGSLLVTTEKNPVGLLFAGNATGNYAIANQIDIVLEAFNVDIDGSQ